MTEPLGTCDYCGQRAIVTVNGRNGCADHIDSAMTGAFVPIKAAVAALPYGGDADPNSGYAAGVATSEERARTADQTGVTGKRQARTLRELGALNPLPGWPVIETGREHGLTWGELADITGWHHGTASGVLSVLHKAGKIARLTERRNRCFVYVLPEYVNGRDTQPQGRPKQPADGLAVALIEAEAQLARAVHLLRDPSFDIDTLMGADWFQRRDDFLADYDND